MICQTLDMLRKNFTAITSMVNNKKVLSAITVKRGGICEAVSKMSFGNKIGMKFTENIDEQELFAPQYGSIIIEVCSDIDLEKVLSGVEYKVLGVTQSKASIDINGLEINIEDMLKVWENTLESIFPTNTKTINEKIEVIEFNKVML